VACNLCPPDPCECGAEANALPPNWKRVAPNVFEVSPPPGPAELDALLANFHASSA
jgi:hypothetical protein